MKPPPLNDMPHSPHFVGLAVKWQTTAPYAEKLPTLKIALAAFERDVEKNGNGLVWAFYSRELRQCVFGCKLAIECAAYSNELSRRS